MHKVIIASKNPVKIQSVEQGFKAMFPEEKFEFSGVSIASGVSDQPMDNEETYQGAVNRAIGAQKAYPAAKFWVGIEGGIQQYEEEMEAFAWIFIQSEDLQGKSRTASFFLPPPVVTLIKEGKELGEADDIVFGAQNSKQKSGAVGLLTANTIVRTSLYSPAVILALIPFKNQNLFLKP